MKTTILLIPALLLVTACSTPQPGANNSETRVVVVKGKSYTIPKAAAVSPYVDEKVITFYQKIGLKECKSGDITWETAAAKEEMNRAIARGDKSVYRKLAKEGHIGCAAAMQ